MGLRDDINLAIVITSKAKLTDLQKTQTEIKKTETATTSLSKQATAAATAMAAAGVAMAVAWGGREAKKGIEQALSLEEALFQISYSANLSRDEINNVKSDIMAFSNEIGVFNAAETAAAYNAIAAEREHADVMLLLRASWDDALGSGMAFSDVVVGLELTMDQFQLTMGEATTVMDAYRAVHTETGATMDMLFQNVGKVGNVASALGLDIVDTIALAGALGDKGVTQMQQMLALLSRVASGMEGVSPEMMAIFDDSGKLVDDWLLILGTLELTNQELALFGARAGGTLAALQAGAGETAFTLAEEIKGGEIELTATMGDEYEEALSLQTTYYNWWTDTGYAIMQSLNDALVPILELMGKEAGGVSLGERARRGVLAPITGIGRIASGVTEGDAGSILSGLLLTSALGSISAGVFGAQHGFQGTTRSPTLFMTSEFGQSEDVSIQPRGVVPGNSGGGSGPNFFGPVYMYGPGGREQLSGAVNESSWDNRMGI